VCRDGDINMLTTCTVYQQKITCDKHGDTIKLDMTTHWLHGKGGQDDSFSLSHCSWKWIKRNFFHLIDLTFILLFLPVIIKKVHR